MPLIEVAVPSLHSQLALTRPGGGGGGVPSKFAWLVGGSICHGHLLLEVCVCARARRGGGGQLRCWRYEVLGASELSADGLWRGSHVRAANVRTRKHARGHTVHSPVHKTHARTSQRFGSDPSVAEGDPQEYIGDMRQLPLGPPGGGGGGTSPEDEPTCLVGGRGATCCGRRGLRVPRARMPDAGGRAAHLPPGRQAGHDDPLNLLLAGPGPRLRSTLPPSPT